MMCVRTSFVRTIFLFVSVVYPLFFPVKYRQNEKYFDTRIIVQKSRVQIDRTVRVRARHLFSFKKCVNRYNTIYTDNVS